MGKDNSDLSVNENNQWSEDYSNWPLQPSLSDNDDTAGGQRPQQPGLLRKHKPASSVTPDIAEFAQDQDSTSGEMPGKTSTGQSSESDLVELQSIAGQFHAAFNTALRELATSRRQITEHSNRVSELELAIEQISTDLDTRVASAREQEEAHNREITELNARIQELDAQRTTALQQIEDLRRQLEAQTREAGELNGRIEELTRERDAQSQENRELQEAHTRESAELNARIQEQDEQRTTALQQIEDLRRQLEAQTREAGELNGRIEELTRERDAQSQENRELQEAHTRKGAELNNKIQELDAQRTTALQQIEDLRRQLEAQTREAGELNGRIEELTRERDAQSQENRELQEAHNHESTELNARIEELEKSLQQANAQCRELEEHSARIEKLNTALHETALSEADLYRKQVEARTREAEDLGKQLEALRTEHRQIEENPPRNDVDDQVVESLQRQIEELSVALEQSEARQRASEAAVRETRDHAGRLETVTRALTIAEDALHHMDERATDPVLYIRDGKSVHANPGYLRIFGEANNGIPELRDFIHPDETEHFTRLLAAEDADPARDEAPVFNLVLPAGDTLTVELLIIQATFGGDPCSRLTLRPQGQANDPGIPREEPGTFDLLTGLYNRQHFLEILEERIMQEPEEQEHQAVMYVLLDNFMLIRNEAGILDSEHVLKEIGELLKSHCNESDVVARFGDCTFTILYRCDSAENITTRAEQVRKLVDDQIAVIGGQSILTTASVGVCLINEYTHNANDILTRADLACEIARTSGGNQVHIHSTIIDEQVDQGNEENWDKLIRDTLEQQRLHLAYQPIISLGDEPGQRYEVLLRILDAENKIILPGQFISVAENIGLSVDIDRYVVESAFKCIAENENNDVMLFIKVSNASVADSGFPAWIREKLEEYRLVKKRIVFEITENVLGKDLKNAALFTRALHDMDCMVAIEHYTGQTQPQHLKHVHADLLKIDGSLISELDKNSEHRTRAAAIVDTARLNQMNTVAERVEDAGSLAMLWDLGINYAQGNFIQEPRQQLDYDFFGEIVSEEDNQGRAVYTVN